MRNKITHIYISITISSVLKVKGGFERFSLMILFNIYAPPPPLRRFGFILKSHCPSAFHLYADETLPGEFLAYHSIF